MESTTPAYYRLHQIMFAVIGGHNTFASRDARLRLSSIRCGAAESRLLGRHNGIGSSIRSVCILQFSSPKYTVSTGLANEWFLRRQGRETSNATRNGCCIVIIIRLHPFSRAVEQTPIPDDGAVTSEADRWTAYRRKSTGSAA
jgi:hypothetical protein